MYCAEHCKNDLILSQTHPIVPILHQKTKATRVLVACLRSYN